MQAALEERGIEVINAALQRLPTSYAEVDGEEREKIEAMVEKMEDDDDVQNVFHNMKPE